MSTYRFILEARQRPHDVATIVDLFDDVVEARVVAQMEADDDFWSHLQLVDTTTGAIVWEWHRPG